MGMGICRKEGNGGPLELMENLRKYNGNTKWIKKYMENA